MGIPNFLEEENPINFYLQESTELTKFPGWIVNPLPHLLYVGLLE